jgi:hypothetical protein
MPKTSNLRSEVNEIVQTQDKSFTITVTVWEIPDSRDSERAVRFQFQTHKNPTLWWRIALMTARQVTPASTKTARYTNAQYNKAVRTATDALNAFIMQKSDAQRMREAKKKLAQNPGSDGMVMLTYGTMPSEVDFMMSASERIEDPFAYYMRLNEKDASAVERAADIGRVELVHRNGMTTVTSSRDMYRLIDALRFMGMEFDNERALSIASAMMGHCGFEWV